MSEKSKQQEAFEGVIVNTLASAGWQKTYKGEQLGKANFEYKNGKVTLEIEPRLDPGWISFSIFGPPEVGADFAIHCPDKLDSVLKTIVSFQDKVTFDDYKPYLSELVNVCSEVYVDDGEDLIPLVEDDKNRAQV